MEPRGGQVPVEYFTKVSGGALGWENMTPVVPLGVLMEPKAEVPGGRYFYEGEEPPDGKIGYRCPTRLTSQSREGGRTCWL
jgi:hypothetical protein